MSCIFCDRPNIILENEFAFARWDEFPVNKRHILFIPEMHIKDFFEITKDKKDGLFDLIDQFKKIIDDKYSPKGYNIGINCGEAAGQTVMHLHIHLIPKYWRCRKFLRRIRGIIPEKKNY